MGIGRKIFGPAELRLGARPSVPTLGREFFLAYNRIKTLNSWFVRRLPDLYNHMYYREIMTNADKLLFVGNVCQII